MDRQIKFRAWDDIANCIRENVFFDGSWWCYGGDDHGTIYRSNINIKVGSTKGKPHIMQYTGLKDCTGKEIYEGDILGEIYLDGWTHKPAAVIFDDGAFSLELEAGKYCPCLYEVPQEHRKVIGNIYEKESVEQITQP